jgi:glycine C-acetyltransferase
MDGYYAPLDQICALADQYDALVMVDDSHAVGFVGATGRGTPERFGVADRVDILTGTLGKALGGASGGYVAARREVVAVLKQRARPYLFSNSVAPAVVGATLVVLDLLDASGELREQLARNSERFRDGMQSHGFELLPGEHAIVPVMFGDAVEASRVASQLWDQGVYAVAFSFPVVPRGEARIRVQLSAAHADADIDRAVAAFAATRR